MDLISLEPSPNAAFERVDRELAQWQEASNADSAWRDVVEEICLDDLAKVKVLKTIQPFDSRREQIAILARVGEARESLPRSQRLRQQTARLYAEDDERLHSMAVEQARAARTLSSILTWGIPINISLALCFLAIFNQIMSARLQKLVESAARLGRRQSLAPPVSGNDELSYIDRVLHEADEQIALDSKRRTKIMSSLTNELSKPLNQARSQLQALEKTFDNAGAADFLHHVSKAKQNIELVLKLTNDLLTIETLSTGKIGLDKSQCNVFTVAEQAISTVSSLARQKQIEVTNKCGDILGRADKVKLEQVLINYLANAIRFSRANQCVEVTSKTSPGMIRISVVDSGPGMDAKTRERVFDRFYQAEPSSHQGFGLGLAICRLIAESHGGRAGVESKEGEGSTFWIEIPN